MSVTIRNLLFTMEGALLALSLFLLVGGLLSHGCYSLLANPVTCKT
jgi:hypothetical protein